MKTWIYQLNQRLWTPETFRYEIWENQRWHWTYGQKRGDSVPGVGDAVIFFYASASGNDPGIYGWAVVERCDLENKILYFIPTAPTNYLKMVPWWDQEARRITDEIRGAMKQATLFQVTDEMVKHIRIGIRQWMSPPNHAAV